MIVGKELNNCFPDHVVLIRLNELLLLTADGGRRKSRQQGALRDSSGGVHGGFRLFMKDKLKATMNPSPPLGTAEQQQAKGENKKRQKSAACGSNQVSGEIALEAHR